jgi:predicted phage tail component-like protein
VASYYVRYNNVDLTNKIGVRTVDTTVLPPRENNSILIWERPGSLYNAYRYSERIITVTFLIKGSSNADVENRLNDLRNIFRVDSPKALYLGTPSRFIYAVPDGDFKMKELRYDCYECEITFVCHDPEYYSSSVSRSSNRSMARSGSSSNMIDVYNGSNASTYPIINIGINDMASFVQVENITTGQKMLLGKYPDPDKSLVYGTSLYYYNMTTLDGWTALTHSYDRPKLGVGYVDGSMDITSSDKGFMLKNTGATTTTKDWCGAGVRKDLSKTATDFRVKARINFNSHGSNGDPHAPRMRDEGTIISGSKQPYYKVMAPAISVKDKVPSMNVTVENGVTNTTYDYGLTIGTLSKGDEVYPIGLPDRGFIQIDYEGMTGYCELTSLKKYIEDSTVTDMVMNVYSHTDTELRSVPEQDMTRSKLLSTIPAGEFIRVYREPVNGFYKLYTKYNNMIGYVLVDDVTYDEYNSGIVCYPEDECIINEDSCTGICEVIGLDNYSNVLFRLTVTDDNEFYEFTKPSIMIGDPDAAINITHGVLLEDKTSVPKSNKSYTYNSDELNVDYDYLEQGSQGGWNNFYGELGVEKDGDKWKAWIYKIENGATVKKLELGETTVTLEGVNGVLSSIAVYIGAKDETYRCGMSVSDITVEGLKSLSTAEGAIFRPGDEIQIDCCNNRVYLNNQLFNNIDIGSDFIELVSGSNDIKVTSNDRDIHATVLFNERYL